MCAYRQICFIQRSEGVILGIKLAFVKVVSTGTHTVMQTPHLVDKGKVFSDLPNLLGPTVNTFLPKFATP